MKRSISQVCNISLKSSVFLNPMATKCSQGHNKVCANIIRLKNIKIDNIFLSMVFNFKQFSFFFIIFDKIGYKYHFL